MNILRALLTGHFSTVGDIESLELVRSWIEDIGIPYDVAPFFQSVREKMPDAVDLTMIDPAAYSHLIMVCGPVWEEQLKSIAFDLNRFRHCLTIGVNLGMVTPVQTWNPFDVLLERESDRLTRPDLTLLAETSPVPVAGRCMVRKQSAYHGREHHEEARRLFDNLTLTRNFAVMDIDTRWYRDHNGLRTPAHVLSAIQRMDVLLTNRLHGMIYALKAGVPVIAIDAIAGGGKVSDQANAVGWPQCIPIEKATMARLEAALDWCLTPQARSIARACRERALPELRNVKQQFIDALTTNTGRTAPLDPKIAT